MNDIIAGGAMVLMIEGMATILFMLWAIMSVGKQADKRLKVPCMYIKGLDCSEECPEWSKHQKEREARHFEQYV